MEGGLLFSGGDGDVFGNFVFFAEGGDARFKLGERDFDRDKVNLGVGFFDEFDEIVAVAVHGDKATRLLARM